MSVDSDFQGLWRRVRQGDPVAAESLIRQYEAELRIIARVRLKSPALRREMDSMDICQSVLANFYVRASAGQFELRGPEDLMKLLATMVRNKVTDKARRQQTGMRDHRRVVASTGEFEPAGYDPTASQVVAAREIYELFQQRLAPEERDLIARRHAGADWDDIAATCGGTPEAIRKRCSRAIDRVAEELGLDQSGLQA